MKLEDTKRLLSRDLESSDATELLVNVLQAAIELLSIEDNDFAWSSWRDADEAVAEVKAILAIVESGELPERIGVSVIFAPTGPMQEVSLSSGWSDAFLKVAERFDYAEKQLWGVG